jgi:hypothetical protein
LDGLGNLLDGVEEGLDEGRDELFDLRREVEKKKTSVKPFQQTTGSRARAHATLTSLLETSAVAFVNVAFAAFLTSDFVSHTASAKNGTMIGIALPI